MVFVGYKTSKKAYLGVDIQESNKQIEAVINENSIYAGGYRDLNGQVIFESVLGFNHEGLNVSSLFNRLCKDEESVYRCNVSSKVKIGSISDTKYLIATIYDLMCSLTMPLQGFTLGSAGNDFYLLICNQGEYIMNPNLIRENSNAIK